MNKNELDKIFSDEYSYINNRAIKIARNSPINAVRYNYTDSVNVVSYVYEVLLKQKNLDVMETVAHVKGKANNILYIELTKTNSRYVKSLTYDNKSNKNENILKNISYIESNHEEILERDILLENMDNYRDKIKYMNKFISILEMRDKDNVDKLYSCFKTYQKDADKVRQNLYDIIINREINTVDALAEHLNVSKYSAYKMYQEFKEVIAYMYSEDLEFNEAIKKINKYNMKRVFKKNKFGVFEIQQPEIEDETQDESEDIIDESDDNIDEEE